jgi:hypothetical protein
VCIVFVIEYAHVCVCVCACLCACVCVYEYTCTCVHMSAYACVFAFFRTQQGQECKTDGMGWDEMHHIESVYCVSHICDHDFKLD